MGDMSLPADYPTIPSSVYDEVKLVKLARQIAMGLSDLPDILFANDLTQREFAEIQKLPHFQRVLESELKAWARVDNAEDRVRVKSASMIEEYLPEVYKLLNDRDEPLMGKVKALELVAKWARIGQAEAPTLGSPGDKVQVIINLGADSKLVYDKQLPAKVIDHEPVTVQPLEQTFEESIDAAPAN
jgi:hypothetical protein